VKVKSQNDISIPYDDIEMKSKRGDSEMDLFQQGTDYLANDLKVNKALLTCVKGLVVYPFI
jgi:hypothetical protein